MAVWENTTKTNAGLALDQKLLGGDIVLKLTKAKSGAGKVNPTQLAAQAEVADPMQDLELKDVIRSDSDTTVTIPVLLSNAGLTEGYALYQVGIYAEDPDLGDILYIIAQTGLEGGERVPSAAESPGFTIDWNFAVNVANASRVEVTLNEAGKLTVDQGDARYAKKEDLEKLDISEKLLDYEKTADVDKKLEGYYTKTEVDDKITAAIEENITAVLEGEY